MTSTAIRIDPRLRARRIAVRRAEGRRRLRTLIMAGSLAALIVGGWQLSQSALLDIDQVRVEGVGTASAERIETLVAAAHGTPLVSIDLQTIESDVTALAWVESAHASRSWPGTLQLEVVERVPFAAIAAGDGSLVVLDSKGVAMASAGPEEATDLPLIAVGVSGKLGSVQVAAVPALAVVAVLPADLRPWVQAIGVDATGALPRLELDLIGGARADLGDSSLLADKLDSVRAVLAGADLACLQVIDVRMADITTLTRDHQCESQSARDADPGYTVSP